MKFPIVNKEGRFVYSKKTIICLAISLISLTVSVSVFSYVIADNNHIEETYGELVYLHYSDSQVIDIILNDPIYAFLRSQNTEGITYFDNTMYILCESNDSTQRGIIEMVFNEQMNTIVTQRLHPLPFLNSSLIYTGLGFDGNNFYTLQTISFLSTQQLCTFNLSHGIISEGYFELPSSNYSDLTDIFYTDFDLWDNKICCTEGGFLNGFWEVRNISLYDINSLNRIDSYNVTNFERPKTFSVDESGHPWIYYTGDPLTEPSSEAKSTRFGRVYKSFLEYSLLDFKLISTTQMGFTSTPRSTQTPLIDGGFNEFYSFNDSLVVVNIEHPVKYTEGIIYPLTFRYNFEYYFLGFRILNYSNTVYTILSSELTTLIVSLITFIGFSTFTVLLFVKKNSRKSVQWKLLHKFISALNLL
ncbi:MAG: hypothetical protein KGD64_14805, partial [Candidatus Heimdallarchaeota archaeon]|nr:hypothetical protein [Candidatus Heimdallarchaeota archaeon]